MTAWVTNFEQTLLLVLKEHIEHPIKKDLLQSLQITNKLLHNKTAWARLFQHETSTAPYSKRDIFPYRNTHNLLFHIMGDFGHIIDAMEYHSFKETIHQDIRTEKNKDSHFMPNSVKAQLDQKNIMYVILWACLSQQSSDTINKFLVSTSEETMIQSGLGSNGQFLTFLSCAMSCIVS